MSRAGAVADFYGRWARLYDLVARRTPGIPGMRARAADAAALGPGETVLEVGCGTGANAPYLRERVGEAGRVVGIDLAPGALARARRRATREGWGNVRFLRGDAARPPVRDADAALATFVVGMLDDPTAAVARWCDLADRVVLLDAARSAHPAAAPLNALFRGFVTLTAPPGTRLRYEEPPAAVLDRRVAAAREALRERGEITADETRGLGFLRLTAART